MLLNQSRSLTPLLVAAAAVAAGAIGIGASQAGVQARAQAISGVQVSSVAVPGGGGTDPIPWGNGGTYGGPGDTVPPGSGGHQIGLCTMELPPVVCGGSPSCGLGWEWIPEPVRCVWPRFGPGVGYPLYAEGFKMTIGTMMDLLESGDDCRDALGNITICVDAPFPTHEVHVFESGWINGYDRDAAINDAVSTAVCIDNDIVMAGWAFEEIARASGCTYPTVCITFNAACMEAALQDWAKAGIDLNAWSDAWLFYVDFVSCDPCE